MALIKCPECTADVSDQAESCPKCGYPINKEVVETKDEGSLAKKKNKSKIFLFLGGASFFISMVMGLGTSHIELGLRAKRLTKGLRGIEEIEWLVLRYVPDFLLWVSIIFFIVGITVLIISKKKN